MLRIGREKRGTQRKEGGELRRNECSRSSRIWLVRKRRGRRWRHRDKLKSVGMMWSHSTPLSLILKGQGRRRLAIDMEIKSLCSPL
jgi:hypothetical protein